MQVVTIPVEEWQQIKRILIRFDKEQKPVSRRAEWKKAADFRKATGLTEEGLRGFRQRHPELVKPKQGPTESGRYLYDIAGYDRIYNS